MLLDRYEQGKAAFKVTMDDRHYLVIVDEHDPVMIFDEARRLWVEENLQYTKANSPEYLMTLNQIVEQSKSLVFDKIENLHLDGYYVMPNKPAAKKTGRKSKAKRAKKPGRKKQAAVSKTPGRKKRTISAEGRKAMSDAAKRRVATKKALQQRVEQEQARQAYIPSANNVKTIRELNRIQTPPSANTPIEEGEGA